MILIADAGGTSINWRIISDDGKISQAVTNGFNAYAHPVGKLQESIESLITQLPEKSIDKV